MYTRLSLPKFIKTVALEGLMVKSCHEIFIWEVEIYNVNKGSLKAWNIILSDAKYMTVNKRSINIEILKCFQCIPIL